MIHSMQICCNVKQTSELEKEIPHYLKLSIEHLCKRVGDNSHLRNSLLPSLYNLLVGGNSGNKSLQNGFVEHLGNFKGSIKNIH